MSSQASGFQYSPVMKSLFFATAGSSVIWQSAGVTSLQPLNVFVDGLVNNFVYKNFGELLLGSGLMYQFRTFERQMGSSKFSSYAFIVTMLSYSIRKSIEKAYGFTQMPTGPYGLLFAMTLKYILDIPSFERLQIFGIPLSNKLFTYLLGIQLLFVSRSGSLMLGICGVLAEFTYRSNIFNIKKFRFPKFLRILVSRTLGNLIGRNPPHPVVKISTRQRRRRTPTPMEGTSEAHRRVQMPVMTDAIQQLTAMGFDESQAIRALQLTNNDIPSAIALLVDQPRNA